MPTPSPSPESLAREAMLIDGKTPWEFACGWYDEQSIIITVAACDAGAFGERHKIPPDVTSEEFGKWLTHEYRMAMHKGIDVAQRSLTTALAERDAEIAQLKSYVAHFKDDAGPDSCADLAAQLIEERRQKAELAAKLEAAETQARRDSLKLANLRTLLRDFCHRVKSAVAYIFNGQRERGEEVLDEALGALVAELNQP